MSEFIGAPAAHERPPNPTAQSFGSLVLLATLAAAVAAALVGTVARVVAPRSAPPSAELARQVVGPDGGTIRFDEGARLVVPAGALTDRHTITIRSHPTDVAAEAFPQSDPTGLRVYSLEPADLRFRVPVRLVVAIGPERDADLVLLVDGEPRRVPVVLDRRAGTVTVRTTDLRFSGAEEEP